jgi:hypothetical protein
MKSRRLGRWMLCVGAAAVALAARTDAAAGYAVDRALARLAEARVGAALPPG